MNKKNILFLYTELAGYTINCMKNAMKINADLQISVVRWEPVSEAPFQFDFGNVKVYNRTDFDEKSLSSLITNEKIDTIICSGWVDKTYVKVCRDFRNRVPTVLALDNQWEGSFKQYLAQVLSPFFIRRNFTHAWVPGDKQFEFVKRLGIKRRNIKRGFYVADSKLFTDYYQEFKTLKEREFPRRFLYVGRYVKHKGIHELWNAFAELHQEMETDWELWCVGTGEEYESRIIHPKIKHFGFLQPDEFSKVISGTGVYVLPSHFEPWGVSVQEFSAAGYPMLLSDKVGASECFLREKDNGFFFQPNNIKELKDSLKKMLFLSEKELIDMQLKSIQLSLSVTIQEWSDSLMSFKL